MFLKRAAGANPCARNEFCILVRTTVTMNRDAVNCKAVAMMRGNEHVLEGRRYLGRAAEESHTGTRVSQLQ